MSKFILKVYFKLHAIDLVIKQSFKGKFIVNRRLKKSCKIHLPIFFKEFLHLIRCNENFTLINESIL